MTNIKTYVVLIAFGLLLSCSEQHNDKEVEALWAESDAASEGINPLTIDSLHSEILKGEYGLIDHFMIIKNGKIVVNYHYQQNYDSIAAKYDATNHLYNYDHPAWHPYYNYTDLHSLQSVTKSITSILLGIAIDEGFIRC